MTKRSLKGTQITTRAGLTRDANASIWLADTTPDSAKDNPLSFTVLQDVVAANIKAVVDGGLVQLTDSTNDCVAFAPSSVIDVSGSVYEVLSVFYIYCAGNVFKVNTGTATLTDTIRLIVSSTEDGLFQTADIDDGTTVVSFGGTTAGDGIVNYSDIRWLGSSLSADIEGGKVDLGLDLIPLTTNTHGIGSASNAWSEVHAYDGNFDEIYDKAGTGAPSFPNGLKIGGSDVMEIYDEGTFTPEFQFSGQVGSFTYGTRTGQYTRIGNIAMAHFEINWTAIPGTGSTLFVTGFHTIVTPASQFGMKGFKGDYNGISGYPEFFGSTDQGGNICLRMREYNSTSEKARTDMSSSGKLTGVAIFRV